MVDDSHAVGFIGENGRGTPELAGVIDRVDIMTGTLGKALGGASGGYVAAQPRSSSCCASGRGRTCSPTAWPRRSWPARWRRSTCCSGPAPARQLQANAALFRRRMTEEGFDLLPGEHPIVPVMFGDAALAARIADAMLERRRLRDRLLLPGGARARRASGCSCRPRTPRTTSIPACVPSSPLGPWWSGQLLAAGRPGGRMPGRRRAAASGTRDDAEVLIHPERVAPGVGQVREGDQSRQPLDVTGLEALGTQHLDRGLDVLDLQPQPEGGGADVGASGEPAAARRRARSPTRRSRDRDRGPARGPINPQ